MRDEGVEIYVVLSAKEIRRRDPGFTILTLASE